MHTHFSRLLLCVCDFLAIGTGWGELAHTHFSLLLLYVCSFLQFEGERIANMLGGYTQFISGCVSQHAMEHAMSGAHQDLTHGVGLLLICDEYFGFFADKPGYAERYGEMAKAMGVNGVDEMSEEETASIFRAALSK